MSIDSLLSRSIPDLGFPSMLKRLDRLLDDEVEPFFMGVSPNPIEQPQTTQ